MRNAFRIVLRNPVMSAVAVVSLAIGMSVNAAAFSIIDTILYKPLPVKDAGTLVRVSGTRTDNLSYPLFEDLRRDATSLTGLTAYQFAGAVFDDGGNPDIVALGLVSANFFSTLGVPAVVGRTLGDPELRADTPPAIVISHRFWQQRFGGDRSVVGRVVKLNTRPWTIVGVLPDGFDGTMPLFAPAVYEAVESSVRMGRTAGERTESWYAVYGRLAPGETVAQAHAEIAALGERAKHAYPDTDGDVALKAQFESKARLRDASVAVVLAALLLALPIIIGCANVTGLLIGHAETRRREIAIQLALGASRGRIIRDWLRQTAVLAALAVGVALIVAVWLLSIVPALLPALPGLFHIEFHIDGRIAALSAGIGLVVTFIAGVLPAWSASRTDVMTLAQSVSPLDRRRTWLRNGLVVGQVAVSFLLVLLASVFGLSLINAERTDSGLPASSMAFAAVAPGAYGYQGPAAAAFYNDLVDRARHQPGIDAAALVSHVPLNSLYGGGARQGVDLPGVTPPPGQKFVTIPRNIVSSGYFAAMALPIVSGRDFDGSDLRGGRRAIIVNETFARTYYPDGDATGRALDLIEITTGAREPATIVGVARDSRYLRLKEAPQPYLYLPLAQTRAGEMTLVARGSGDEAGLADRVRASIRAINAALPPVELITKTQHLRRALFAERTLAGSVTVLGGLSLLLAVIGLYGVVAFSVARRTRDIGIEMSLGATPGQVRRRVLAHGLRLTLIGIAIGGVFGVLAIASFAGGLYGVTASDPRILLIALVCTVPITLIATYLPARRASLINPIEALRR
jgi:putative ABC transport system permease protein